MGKGPRDTSIVLLYIYICTHVYAGPPRSTFSSFPAKRGNMETERLESGERETAESMGKQKETEIYWSVGSQNLFSRDYGATEP